MTLNARYEIRDGYLYMPVSGDFDHTTVHGLLRACVDQARNHNLTRVLCDVTSVTGLEPDAASFWDRMEVGEYAAHALPKDMQVAVLQTPQQLIGGRVVGDFMVQRGIQVRVTSDLQEALDWLEVTINRQVDSPAAQPDLPTAT